MVAATAATTMGMVVPVMIMFGLLCIVRVALATTSAATAATASGFFGDRAEELFDLGVEEPCVVFEVPAVIVGNFTNSRRAIGRVHALAVPL